MLSTSQSYFVVLLAVLSVCGGCEDDLEDTTCNLILVRERLNLRMPLEAESMWNPRDATFEFTFPDRIVQMAFDRNIVVRTLDGRLWDTPTPLLYEGFEVGSWIYSLSVDFNGASLRAIHTCNVNDPMPEVVGVSVWYADRTVVSANLAVDYDEVESSGCGCAFASHGSAELLIPGDAFEEPI